MTTPTDEEIGGQDDQAQQIDRLLQDPSTKAMLLERLVGKQTPRGTTAFPNPPCLTPSGTNETGDTSRASTANPMANAWPPPCPPWWFQIPPYFPFPPAPVQPLAPPHAGTALSSSLPSCSGSSNPGAGRPGSSRKRHLSYDASSSSQGSEEEDAVTLLSDSEALELVEFDPAVQPEDSWEAPAVIKTFLDKHFNKSLSEEERKKILKDFPKPSCDAVQVPRLDDQLKEHLKTKGKDPHYGSEKTLYKLQESLLEVVGPLACLWGDLLNKDVKFSPESVLLLVQRALVLLGNASHAVSQERRKVAWAKVNPKLRSLATEDYSKRGPNLFGPGFLEKASKRIELDKTMTKVSLPSGAEPASKRRKLGRDRHDLRNFLDRGSSAKYGSGKARRPLPYQAPKQFQSKRYFQARPRTQDKSKAKSSKSAED